jgi:hypothetical protein
MDNSALCNSKVNAPSKLLSWLRDYDDPAHGITAGITLVKSTWPGADQLAGYRGVVDPVLGWGWVTNMGL